MTVRVVGGMPSLRDKRLVSELERSFRGLLPRKDFRLCEYSVQRDHAHFIVEARDRDALGCGMKALGGRFGRAVTKVFRRSGRVLAERYHLHILKSPREVRNALAYVLRNAAKHARRLGIAPVHRLDPASSARWFRGWRHPVKEPDESAPVAAPHTWSLRVGWRRYGLIPLR